jgi:hypothetical protein
MTYITGQLKLTRKGVQFTLNGLVMPETNASDHFQLIYEALEIAARSNDEYAKDFAAMRDELMALTEDWGD